MWGHPKGWPLCFLRDDLPLGAQGGTRPTDTPALRGPRGCANAFGDGLSRAIRRGPFGADRDLFSVRRAFLGRDGYRSLLIPTGPFRILQWSYFVMYSEESATVQTQVPFSARIGAFVGHADMPLSGQGQSNPVQVYRPACTKCGAPRTPARPDRTRRRTRSRPPHIRVHDVRHPRRGEDQSSGKALLSEPSAVLYVATNGLGPRAPRDQANRPNVPAARGPCGLSAGNPDMPDHNALKNSRLSATADISAPPHRTSEAALVSATPR